MDLKDPHDHIVHDVLPRIAEKLKKERIISRYGRPKQFRIALFEEGRFLRINPDMILRRPNGDRILVEVANQRDPKRFVGEIVYPIIS